MAVNVTTKDLLKKLNIVFATQLVSVALFIGFAYILSGKSELNAELSRICKYVLLVMVPLGYIGGNFIYKKYFSSVAIGMPLQAKLIKVNSAMLVRWACNEVPGMMAAYMAFSTGDISLLLFTGISLALLFTLRPNKEAIMKDLPLTEAEKDLLDDPDGVLYQTGK